MRYKTGEDEIDADSFDKNVEKEKYEKKILEKKKWLIKIDAYFIVNGMKCNISFVFSK